MFGRKSSKGSNPMGFTTFPHQSYPRTIPHVVRPAQVKIRPNTGFLVVCSVIKLDLPWRYRRSKKGGSRTDEVGDPPGLLPLTGAWWNSLSADPHMNVSRPLSGVRCTPVIPHRRGFGDNLHVQMFDLCLYIREILYRRVVVKNWQPC